VDRRGSFLANVVDECRVLGAKPSDFTMEENHNLCVATGPHLEDAGSYRQLVGRPIYLTITSPDLCYAVHILPQFIQAPREEHMNAVRRVLRYIKGSPDCGIVIHAHCDLQLIAYCDSDWGACLFTRRSLTGYLVTLGGSPIS